MDQTPLSETVLAAQREQMVEQQIRRRGVTDPAVLHAMRMVPRHKFMPPELVTNAYDDGPMPIGYGQTISQPYVVASMTELLRLTPQSRVLEVGTGSAYQTAVLAEIAQSVCTIEVRPELAEHARALLQAMHYRNVYSRVGDGSLGWPEEAPFEAIIVTAAAREIPYSLVNQLSPNGRMVIPVRSGGSDSQDLILVHKDAHGAVSREVLYPVRFVPLHTE